MKMSDRIRFGEPIELEIPTEELPPASLIAATAGTLRHLPLQIYMLQEVYADIISHVNQSPRLESGGVLVGHPFRTEDNRTIFVIIVGALPQHSNQRSVGHFTVGPTEIAAVREDIEQRYRGLITVGWYHSHPGHGIFLSGQDMAIVHSIYNLPWHVAMVVDPIQRIEGLFVGPEGRRLGDSWKAQSWIGLTTEPDSIRAISLYNQAHEALAEGRFPTAVKALDELQQVLDTSEQLRHWNGRYRDTDRLREQLRESALQNARSIPPSAGDESTGPNANLSTTGLSNHVSSQSALLSATFLQPSRSSTVVGRNWWLWLSSIAATLFAVYVVLSIVVWPDFADRLVMLGWGVLISVLSLVMAGYVVLAPAASTTIADPRLIREARFSPWERTAALLLTSLVIVGWTGYVIAHVPSSPSLGVNLDATQETPPSVLTTAPAPLLTATVHAILPTNTELQESWILKLTPTSTPGEATDTVPKAYQPDIVPSPEVVPSSQISPIPTLRHSESKNR